MNLENHIAIDLFNKAPFGYIITQEDGTIIKINDTLLSLIQSNRDALLGKKRFQDLLNVGGRIYYETHYLPLLIHQKEVQEINFDMRSNKGTNIPVLVNTNVIKEKGEQLFFLSTVIDISQRKLYERELYIAKERAQEVSKKLEEANQELKNFSHVLSHDVKSPLVNIIGLLDLVDEDMLSEEERSEYFNLVRNSTSGLLDMIDGILKYHINSDIDSQIPKKISIQDLITKIAQLADPESKIELTIVDEEKTIKTYSVIIEMILLNLLVNAIKYNDKEIVRINVLTSSDEKYYHFTMSDNGRGIDEKDFKRIFEPSNTLEVKDRFNSKGTGLGLSYVKKMVEKLGGAIKVQSKLGTGSTFSFTIIKIQEKTANTKL
ncbi:sensor histidine kinase [Formosa sp. PL04]|uniref:sensor histidine kinase n=1 Tax=Formosa sp. PL04 TaxID=3081755 RepID=UPI002980A480|nr:ATP-binding protein [Formosa sp. PL04]MDW5290201.1 ATP-binding protein [Formosa sp. PL04]